MLACSWSGSPASCDAAARRRPLSRACLCPARPLFCQVACQQLVAQLQECFAALRERLQAFMQLEAQRKHLSK